MSRLFEKTDIKGMELSSRFVRSATWEGMAGVDGTVTQKLTDTLTSLARGGVGLIISSHVYVSKVGQASPWQLGIFDDNLIAGLKELTSKVHQSGTSIVCQLAHAGHFALKSETGEPPLVASDIKGLSKSPRHEMTNKDIKELVTDFAEAARRAKLAGFDGVQIHAAHGYLLSQFLSPAFNQRQDEYGGEIQNRSRVHLDVYHAVRETVGNDYPVLIKINCQDFIDNGLELKDSVTVGKLLAEAGLDAIELSGGMLTSGKLLPSRTAINTEEREAYFTEEALIFKQEIGIPLIQVGGTRSFNVAERLVDSGVTDYISLSRPLIREPGLVNRWKKGDRNKAKCISCNKCFEPARAGKGIFCVTEQRARDKAAS